METTYNCTSVTVTVENSTASLPHIQSFRPFNYNPFPLSMPDRSPRLFYSSHKVFG